MSMTTGDPAFSFYGVNINEGGGVTDFSVPFIIMNMIGGGLSWFIAIAWSNVFQSALDDYKAKQQAHGDITNPIWMNLLLALVATLFTVSILYLMIKAYQHIRISMIKKIQVTPT